jgi:hypothetical protein
MERAALDLGSSDGSGIVVDEERRAVDVKFLAVVSGRIVDRARGVNMTIVLEAVF